MESASAKVAQLLGYPQGLKDVQNIQVGSLQQEPTTALDSSHYYVMQHIAEGNVIGDVFPDCASATAKYDSLGHRYATLLTDDSFAQLKYYGLSRSLSGFLFDAFRVWWLQNKIVSEATPWTPFRKLRPGKQPVACRGLSLAETFPEEDSLDDNAAAIEHETQLQERVRKEDEPFTVHIATSPHSLHIREEVLPPMSSPSEDKPTKIARWKRGAHVGAGAQGLVFKAQDCDTGRLFVVKEKRMQYLGHTLSAKDVLVRELEICKDLDHPNIVQYLGHDFHGSALRVFLEYIPGGSLRSMLEEFGALEEQLMPVAMRGLLEGLEYLHTRSPAIVHRDIKSANILVSPNLCLKLCDFGVSKCAVDDISTSFTTIGSVLWMAPEVMGGQAHGRKADIWSLGCVFIEMVTAELPWGSYNFDNAFCAMRHISTSKEMPPIPETLSESLRGLIEQCVQLDPGCRPWASELLRHGVIAPLGCSANEPSSERGL